ncbi:hypothetical protein [Paraburkholderia kururiensis]|uniref:hypothetical protein n=1 Tax=Paraburkholderia kururiensis TaxID=984307 RepID=UPI0018F59FA6|nr:hypothetical protein [Paraburkholderia kururiensis]
MTGSLFLLYLAAKTMPDRFEPWGWMPVAGRARLVGELRAQRPGDKALQNERDQLPGQNGQHIAQTADRTVEQW